MDSDDLPPRTSPILAEGLHGRAIRAEMPIRSTEEVMKQVREEAFLDGDPRRLQRMLNRGQITQAEYDQHVKPWHDRHRV